MQLASLDAGSPERFQPRLESLLRRCQKIDNLLERDYQRKLAMGFPPAAFTRIGGLLRKPKV